MKPADSRSRCTYVKEEESKPRGARAASDLICIQTVAPFQFPRADDSLKTSIVRAASGIFAIVSSLFQSEWLMEDSWIVGTQYEGGGQKKKEFCTRKRCEKARCGGDPWPWWVHWGGVWNGVGNCELGGGVRYEGGNISYRLVFWPWKSAIY